MAWSGFLRALSFAVWFICVAAAQAQDAAPGRTNPFAAGSWTFQTYGSAAFGDDDKGEMYTAHVGVGYYFLDNLSINLEPFGAAVDSNVDDDGGAIGFDLLFRWHFLTGDKWSIYMDGGAGLQQASTDFPSDNHFNFRPQLGFGATYEIADNVRLMGGAKYLHISNAGITDDNDGFDGSMPYLGLIVGF